MYVFFFFFLFCHQPQTGSLNGITAFFSLISTIIAGIFFNDTIASTYQSLYRAAFSCTLIVFLITLACAIACRRLETRKWLIIVFDGFCCVLQLFNTVVPGFYSGSKGVVCESFYGDNLRTTFWVFCFFSMILTMVLTVYTSTTKGLVGEKKEPDGGYKLVEDEQTDKCCACCSCCCCC